MIFTFVRTEAQQSGVEEAGIGAFFLAFSAGLGRF